MSSIDDVFQAIDKVGPQPALDLAVELRDAVDVQEHREVAQAAVLEERSKPRGR